MLDPVKVSPSLPIEPPAPKFYIPREQPQPKRMVRVPAQDGRGTVVAGVRYVTPSTARLFFEPGAMIRLPMFHPGSREGVAVELVVQEPDDWECQYGCAGVCVPPAVAPTHSWNCPYWNREGKCETPFD